MDMMGPLPTETIGRIRTPEATHTSPITVLGWIIRAHLFRHTAVKERTPLILSVALPANPKPATLFQSFSAQID